MTATCDKILFSLVRGGCFGLCYPSSEHVETCQGVQTNDRWAWWHVLLIQALGRLGQEKGEFKGTVGYIASSMPAWAMQQNLLSEINKGKTVLFQLKEVSKVAKFIETENRMAPATQLEKESKEELPGA